ncbi:MAG: TetR family transcriptional regulator, partial [Brevundimonas sp.]
MTTRDELLAAAAATLADVGLAGASARSIAARAQVNQALIFYHFGSVSELLEAAVRSSVDAALADYRERLADVETVAGLVALARELHSVEKARGNVAQMTQVLAGAQRDATLARAATYAITAWRDEVEVALRRVLATSALRDVVDPAAIAATATAGFIGLSLYEGVDPDGAEAALGSLDVLAALAEVIDGLGPVTTRVVRSRLRHLVPAARG